MKTDVTSKILFTQSTLHSPEMLRVSTEIAGVPAAMTKNLTEMKLVWAEITGVSTEMNYVSTEIDFVGTEMICFSAEITTAIKEINPIVK